MLLVGFNWHWCIEKVAFVCFSGHLSGFFSIQNGQFKKKKCTCFATKSRCFQRCLHQGLCDLLVTQSWSPRSQFFVALEFCCGWLVGWCFFTSSAPFTKCFDPEGWQKQVWYIELDFNSSITYWICHDLSHKSSTKQGHNRNKTAILQRSMFFKWMFGETTILFQFHAKKSGVHFCCRFYTLLNHKKTAALFRLPFSETSKKNMATTDLGLGFSTW